MWSIHIPINFIWFLDFIFVNNIAIHKKKHNLNCQHICVGKMISCMESGHLTRVRNMLQYMMETQDLIDTQNN